MQSWIVKTDKYWNKEWDKTILSDAPLLYDYGFGQQLDDSSYFFANFSTGGVAGEKSEPNKGVGDYWLIRYYDSTLSRQQLMCISSILSTGEDAELEDNLVVHPNPFHYSLILDIEKQEMPMMCIKVLNLLGIVVFTESGRNLSHDNSLNLDLNFLLPGIYFLEIEKKSGVIIKQIVKEWKASGMIQKFIPGYFLTIHD